MKKPCKNSKSSLIENEDRANEDEEGEVGERD